VSELVCRDSFATSGGSTPISLLAGVQMSEQSFFHSLKFLPKIVTLPEPILHQREVVVEVPKRLVLLRQSELVLVNEDSTEKVVALGLARRAALGTFPTLAERILGLYDVGLPTWFGGRPPVIDERPCDYEEDGLKAWRIR